jgi:beta-galactosidase
LVEAKPFVYIAHLMTPFSPEDIVVFTNCEAVKLTMYGKEIGIKSAVDASSPVPRVPVVFEDVFRYVDARNKNKKSYGKIDQEWVNEALIQAEGLINGQVVAKHQRWPVGRKRRLVLKVDDSAVPPLADGSDITPVVAYLVDAGGAVKRLSDEYIRFSVSGEGTLIGGPEKGMNPQKLLWGEAVALIRSGVKPGTITVRAEVLEPGTNAPESAKIEFQTHETGKNRLYKELPTQTKQQTDESSFLDENQILKSLREELRKTQKELQEYRINEVGRQQQDFIQ